MMLTQVDFKGQDIVWCGNKRKDGVLVLASSIGVIILDGYYRGAALPM